MSETDKRRIETVEMDALRRFVLKTRWGGVQNNIIRNIMRIREIITQTIERR